MHTFYRFSHEYVSSSNAKMTSIVYNMLTEELKWTTRSIYRYAKSDIVLNERRNEYTSIDIPFSEQNIGTSAIYTFQICVEML